MTVYTGQFEMDQPLDGEASGELVCTEAAVDWESVCPPQIEVVSIFLTFLAEYITDERYHGQMKAGCRQGNGKSVSDIGSSYRGEWQMDQPHGFGGSF